MIYCKKLKVICSVQKRRIQMSLEKKKQFVMKTYEILKEEGTEGVKIRRIGKEMNCTSTVVYRYFDNVDHLIALASIRFLNDYINDFKNMVNDPRIFTDPYSLNLEMWECLADYAFQNIPIYENLFFGSCRDSLSEVMFEYYQLFLDEYRQDFDGYSTSILFTGDIFQRDYVLLRRAVAIGRLTDKEALTLSRVECHVFHGVLLKYMENYKEPGIPDKASAEFKELLHELAEKFRR